MFCCSWLSLGVVFLVRLQDNSSVIVVVVVVDGACDGVINSTSGADVCAGAADLCEQSGRCK
jgi:hypothetical protein